MLNTQRELILPGQAINSKDLHAAPQDIAKSLLEGTGAIKSGMVISMSDGRAVKYNGIAFALVTENMRKIGFSYTNDASDAMIEVSKKGCRVVLAATNDI